MNYKKILIKMRKEEEDRLRYLNFIICRPAPIQTKEYYKKEIDICKAKIDALSLVIN